MKKFIFTAALLLLLAVLSACGGTTDAPAETAEENISAEQKALSSMTLEEKVGQLFLVRCDDSNMDEILDMSPAGIIMFGVDFENLTRDEVIEKISGYKEKSKYPLLIAVDEEGGTVVRVSSNPNLSAERYKSPREYFEEGGLEKIRENTAEKSQLLAGLGINMNLAPVADVSTDPNDFIYDRAFGRDAAATSEYVREVVEVTAQNGIYSCLKHFPGYGSNADTHTGIAVDERPMEVFTSSDFLPFEAGIAAGADSVLVSHNIMTCVDSSQPASISPAVHTILRDTLGFDGVIVTDDMAMDAMAGYGKPYVKAVLAGNDLIIASDFTAGCNEIMSAVKNGEISEEMIDVAVLRTIAMREKYLSFD